MNATQLFIGLITLFIGLFVIALANPYFAKKLASIDDFKKELSRLLPNHDLMIKHGSQSRIIVSLDGIQKAIVIMDKPKADYVMGGLPIFTTDNVGGLKPIADKIGVSAVVVN